MELRQLRYFVTLSKELHFGRAAAREHIVQSALSQQVQRLEREIGAGLFERSTHHVSLTAAGGAFLVEARQILAHVVRSAEIARSAMGASPTLRAGIIDASYDSMPQILHEVQARYPDLVIHQVEAGVPEQFQQIVDGRLDVGIGRAALAPPQVASQLFRWDPLGSWSPARTGLRRWTESLSRSWPRNRCCSPRTRGLRSSTSSPSRCAGRLAGDRRFRPCTRHRWLRTSHVRETGLAASRGSDHRLTGRVDGGLDRPGRRQQVVFHPRHAHHTEQYDRRKQRY
jgi:DNA-binding transcriptional LysR family regulator